MSLLTNHVFLRRASLRRQSRDLGELLSAQSAEHQRMIRPRVGAGSAPPTILEGDPAEVAGISEPFPIKLHGHSWRTPNADSVSSDRARSAGAATRSMISTWVSIDARQSASSNSRQ